MQGDPDSPASGTHNAAAIYCDELDAGEAGREGLALLLAWLGIVVNLPAISLAMQFAALASAICALAEKGAVIHP